MMKFLIMAVVVTADVEAGNDGGAGDGGWWSR